MQRHGMGGAESRDGSRQGKGVVKRRLLGVKEHPIASFVYQLTNV